MKLRDLEDKSIAPYAGRKLASQPLPRRLLWYFCPAVTKNHQAQWKLHLALFRTTDHMVSPAKRRHGADGMRLQQRQHSKIFLGQNSTRLARRSGSIANPATVAAAAKVRLSGNGSRCNIKDFIW